MQKRFVYMFAVFAFIMLAASLVLAENETSGNNTTVKNETKEKKCFNMTSRIEHKIKDHLNARDNNIKHFSKASERISILAGKAEEKGYNVTKLQADLNTFNEMINKTKADYELF